MNTILEVLEHVRSKVRRAKNGMFGVFMCNEVRYLRQNHVITHELSKEVRDYIWDNIPQSAVDNMTMECECEEIIKFYLKEQSGAWYGGDEYELRLTWLDEHIKKLSEK